MKIRTKLYINGLIMMGSALAIGIVLLGFAWRSNTLREEQAKALVILGEARVLSGLGIEYVLYRESRVLEQWNRLHGIVEKILKNVHVESAEEQRIIVTINHDLLAAKALMKRLAEMDEMPSFRHSFDGETILIGQLLIKTQDLASRTFELEQTYDRHGEQANKLVGIWIAAMVTGLALLNLALNLYFARSLGKPITKLTEGANALGSGQLDHRIGFRRNDELGELAAAFDGMADQILQVRAELENRVQQRTSELAAANRELEAYAYTVSHDLRAPLRAMGGYARMVLENYAPSLDEEGRRKLEVIRDNAQKMGQLIDDLLAFSLMGQRDMALVDVDMTALATEVAEELRQQESGRTIKIEISPLPDVPGDRPMLRQVWVNLLSNAIKFTRMRKQASIEINALTEAGEYIYIVKDNGAGFDMQHRDKLFRVFQRLHGHEKYEGVGLGLAIVKRIIERLGGRIWAEGKVDQGATFYFALPK